MLIIKGKILQNQQKMIEESFNAISNLIESRSHIAKQAFEIYEPLVNNIIASQNKDVNHISITLDYVLSFCFDEQMLLLYRRLCRYLFDIDQESTAFYINAYSEMWDEEGKMFGKNSKEEKQ